jgi:TatD DNase family protein
MNTSPKPNPEYLKITSGIIDSHAHVLREYFGDEQSAVIERAFAANVTQIVNPGINAQGIEELEELVERHTNLFIGVGIHPHDAKTWSDSVQAKIETALLGPKVVAVGECGLDFYYNNSDREVQIAAFHKQIELSIKSSKPLIIHCRDAWEDMKIILSQYGPKVRGVFHCFTGDEAILEALLPFDFYISFSGIVTFPSAKPIQRAAALVNKDRLLVETDCPFLSPQKFRGLRNEPSYIWQTAEQLAALRSTSLVELAAQVTANARRLFGLPEPF